MTISFLNQQLDYFNQAQAISAKTAGVFDSSVTGVNRTLQSQRDELMHTGELWDMVLDDLAERSASSGSSGD